jgi:hypothetical protein
MPEMYSTPVQSDNVTPTSEVRPDSGYQQSPKTSSYPYFTENSRKFISFTTYAGLSGYFSEERHKSLFGSETDVVLERLMNDSQDEYLQPFIETIRKRSSNPDDHAKIAISLVQHMPYNANKPYHDTGEWFFPYETLYRNGGSSADKSLLTAYLLKELGYETVLFAYPGRMTVGVKCSPDYDFYDTGFAFIEATEPTIITYVPDAYGGVFSISGTMRIIRLDEGKRVLDVSTEYRDALRLKELERMGGVLNQTQFTEWQKISNQYDLQ